MKKPDFLLIQRLLIKQTLNEKDLGREASTMNRKIAVIAAAAVLSCTFGMTGCSDFSMGTDSLLRPPRATGDKAEIQNIIDKEAGGNYVFKS